MLNKALSRQIFRELMHGRVINAHTVQDGERVPNERFDALFRDYDSVYRELYDQIGYELVLGPGYAFIRSLDAEEGWNDVAMRVHALLLILARGVQEQGYDFRLLSEFDAGVTEAMLMDMETDERRDMLRACGLKGSLLEEVRRVLEGRQILWRNHRGAWVLSEAGQGFFRELFGEEETSNKQNAPAAPSGDASKNRSEHEDLLSE